uniref:BART domain-containing protein n=1 Tax=Hemiselmis andersenii TaxID=464988 RepID=A0A7S0U476_HEMAN|mmetsp:Transcript_32364/g.75362  ORF Transcript_32364/g.75362 Transcript_32364/m.75362 type:complete len:153 (+) Transcript_32364:139-597(+)
MSDLYQQLATYLETSGFQEKLFDFLGNECAEMSSVADTGEEQSLEMYAVYQKYTAMFDDMFEEFMREIGASSVEEMQERLQTEMSEKEQSNRFYEALLASMEYSKFAQLVKNFLEADEDGDEDEDEDEDKGVQDGEGESEDGEDGGGAGDGV